ncbi:MAG: class I adenylate-forming enzyme family protein [Sporichthyaceae bacterium]
MIPTTTQRRAALEARHPTWVARTISQQFDHAAAEFGDRPFYIGADRSYTYAEIRGWSKQIASGLIAHGIQPQDHVAMVMGNYPEYVAVKLAISRVGAVAVPINYNLRRNELAYILGQSDARALFVMDSLRDLDYVGDLDAIVPGWDAGSPAGGAALPGLNHVFVLATEGGEPERGTSIATLAASSTPESDAALPVREAAGDPHFRADVIYTSGTTGRPKGSMCTHDMLNRMAYSSAYTRAFEDGRRIIFALPMYHVFGYVECMMAVSFVGGALIPYVAFDAETMLAGVEKYQASELVGVPLMTLAEIDLLKEKSFDLSSLVAVFNSGGLSPAWIWGRIREVFGVSEVCTGYGMTETTASTACVLPEDPDERFTSHGRMKLAGVAGEAALGGGLAQYRAVDPATGEEVPAGEQGELICRGPVITLGYYNKPEETAEAFTADGWFRTGDMGTIDADGYLTLTGRLKESYRCNGEMVMPKEIEDLLNEHPLVKATYVVGIPHPKAGEVGCVCVVAAGETRPDPDELIQLCRDNLARFKVPRHVIFVTAEEVPMTVTARPQKFKLLELAKARLAETGQL